MSITKRSGKKIVSGWALTTIYGGHLFLTYKIHYHIVTRNIHFRFAKKIGDEIEGQTKYILCTRHKSLHRKSVEVCLKCRYRKGCKDFKQYQQPELAMELNKLMGAFHKKPLGSEALEHFKKELTDIKSLC